MGEFRKTDIQLYNLVTKLSSYVDNTDDLGTIVGYSIIGGLNRFNTSVGSKSRSKKKLNPETVEQYKFEEVRAVYSQLESTLDSVKNVEFQEIISHLAFKLNPEIEYPIQNSKISRVNSTLLRNILSNLGTERNYQDNLRKNGIKLVDILKSKGSYNRPHDYLSEDYRAIALAFVPKVLYHV